MFKLKISDISAANLLSKYWATHTISLLDPGIDENDFLDIKLPEASENGKIRRYFFHDIADLKNISFLIFLGEESKPILASNEDIQDILEFTASLQSTDKLLVHCQAGISRSTATACGILCQHGLTPIEAVKQVVSIRSQAFPNSHILKLFDKYLELQGELVLAGTKDIFRLRDE